MASLKELQQALAARLTTSHNSTESDQSQEVLREFDAEELQQSRETLIRKRLGQIASLLPGTRRQLGDQYDRLCREFIDQHHFQGFQAPQLDAIYFARWLEANKSLELWKLGIAGLEGMRVRWTISSFFVSVRQFRVLANDTLGGGNAAVAQRTTWMAIRFGRWGLFRRLM